MSEVSGRVGSKFCRVGFKILCFCNDPLGLIINDYLDPLGTSDHAIIDFSVFLPIDSSSNTTPSGPHSLPIVLPTYDWANANFQAINECLNSFDWNWIFGYNFDADSIWLQFKSVLMSVISLHVPVKFISHTVKHNVRRYPNHIRKLLTR